MDATPTLRASEQDGHYPRPQLVRERWADLTGTWEFEVGTPGAADLDSHRLTQPLKGVIEVPFPPESPASGVGRTEPTAAVWYRRWVTGLDVSTTGHRPGNRLLLHFGAVDYQADVWIGGSHHAHHEGGHTPFTVDVTAAAAAGADFDVVVRAQDDPEDVEKPRGKQDWRAQPHVIWYHRTTGIWQPVWLESVPAVHITRAAWFADVPGASVNLALELSETPATAMAATVTIEHAGTRIARVITEITRERSEIRIGLDVLRNGQDYERFLWSPENPTLLDARIELSSADDRPGDVVASYFGLRSVSTEGGAFLLNDRPYHVKAVLSQGYWPASHLAAPSHDALRAEVELIKDLGFDTARVHQKVEDPRFLYWADRLGLMIWAELPGAFEFSSTSVERSVREWLEILRRDASHPSITVWVPLNESWGVQHIAHDPRQLSFARSLYLLTKSVDPTRLVVSNDGWEHAESDLLTVHDYENAPATLAASYADQESVTRTLTGVGPGKRRIRLLSETEAPIVAKAPVMLSEFGGVSFDARPDADGWGYAVVRTEDEFRAQLQELFRALHTSTALAGWCYTQLTDTAQETNGLTDEARVPKLPAAVVRAIVRG